MNDGVLTRFHSPDVFLVGLERVSELSLREPANQAPLLQNMTESFDAFHFFPRCHDRHLIDGLITFTVISRHQWTTTPP
ncbi:hypothetical protein [Cryobacterium sp. Y62]|uniref:hypothetical protein n=1 Tax=Cryobacterium sp. Y62 TaxID=2048284 RepID=UPI0011B0C2C4|nr:hypothetical protein [Cryobacterium sp. Y62]